MSTKSRSCSVEEAFLYSTIRRLFWPSKSPPGHVVDLQTVCGMPWVILPTFISITCTRSTIRLYPTLGILKIFESGDGFQDSQARHTILDWEHTLLRTEEGRYVRNWGSSIFGLATLRLASRKPPCTADVIASRLLFPLLAGDFGARRPGSSVPLRPCR